MFGRRKNKGKKVKLTEEQKAYYLYHYGTSDIDEINDMMEKLYLERTTQRVNEYFRTHDVPREKQPDIVKFIVRFAYQLGFEQGRNAKNGLGTEAEDLITAKMMYRIDTSILTKQLEENGYSKEDAENLVKNSYPFTINELLKYRSLKVEDYDIVDGKMVMKLEKDIFERYLKDHQKQDEKAEVKVA